MSAEVLRIASNKFVDQTKGILEDLFKRSLYSDVTLVTEDQKTLKAHRFILEGNSPVFKTIFDQANVDNQTVFLRGIKHDIMSQILQFCYMGYVEIHHEKIWDFFAVAVDLKVNKLCEMTEDVLKKSGRNEKPVTSTEKAPDVDPLGISNDVRLLEEDTSVALDEGDKKMVEEATEFLTNVQNQVAKVKKEPRVKKEPTNSTDALKCEECGQVFTFIGNLRRHNMSVHQGVKYGCDECDYKATQSTDIKRHKAFKHEGVRFDCSMCEYKATTKGSLKVHFEAKHQGIKYPCSECEYKATTMASLNMHVQSRHSDIQLQCEFCDFKCKSKLTLKSHKKKSHTYGVMQF